MKRIILCLILLLIFIGNAEAVEPFDTQAGMSAYVNVGPLNLENATEAYTQIYNLSTSHAVGTINIANNYGSDNIHVYVDTNGWIVAYLTRDEELGHMIQWSGINYNNPTLKTTFEDAISKMCSRINVNYSVIQNNIKYYDFEYPQASNILISMNTLYSNISYESEYSTVYIPEAYTIHEMSYSHFVPSGTTVLYVDGTVVSSLNSNRRVGNYDLNMFTKNNPHTIQLYNHHNHIWSGVANIILYN